MEDQLAASERRQIVLLHLSLCMWAQTWPYVALSSLGVAATSWLVKASPLIGLDGISLGDDLSTPILPGKGSGRFRSAQNFGDK